MSKVLLALVAATAALNTAAMAIAEELGADVPQGAPGEGGTAGDAPRKRGRPAGSGAAAAATPAAPATEPVAEGKTLEELKAAIKPLVEAGQVEDIKKLIAKHGGADLKSIPPANHAAFLRDVEAMSL